MREVVIVSAARTPFGKFGGLLKDFTAVDLGTQAVAASLKRITWIPPRLTNFTRGRGSCGHRIRGRPSDSFHLRSPAPHAFPHHRPRLLFLHDLPRVGAAEHSQRGNPRRGCRGHGSHEPDPPDRPRACAGASAWGGSCSKSRSSCATRF